MKRLMAVLLLCALLWIPIPSYAASKVLGWGSVNNTGEQVVTTIPTTTIIPKRHKILGVAIINIAPTDHSECFASFEDIVPVGSGGTATTVAEIIAEAEVDNGGGTEWFLYPVSLYTQLKVHQGAYTEILVYYSR